MKAYLKFIKFSIIYAILWEGLIHLIVLDHAKFFVFILLTYIPILSTVYLVTRLTFAKYKSLRSMILCYLFLGLIGLIVLEWGLLGNSPKANPNANQITMFCYWASIGFIPYMMQDQSEPIKLVAKKFKIFFTTFFFISWTTGFVLTMPANFVVSILLMMVWYIFMNGYVFAYITKDTESNLTRQIARFLPIVLILAASFEQYLHSID